MIQCLLFVFYYDVFLDDFLPVLFVIVLFHLFGFYFFITGCFCILFLIFVDCYFCPILFWLFFFCGNGFFI